MEKKIEKFELEELIKNGFSIIEMSNFFDIKFHAVKYLLRKFKLKLIPDFTLQYSSCSICGKEFSYKARNKKINTHCSRSCANSKPHNKQTKEKISKTLTKPFQLRRCENCNEEFSTKRKSKKFCTKSCFAKHRNKSTDYKINLSEKRINYLTNNNSKWYETQNILGEMIKVQGTWEFEFAKRLNELKVIYERKSVNITNCNKYTPDFYLPEFDIFVEIKGFLYEKDKYKMLKSIEFSGIDLRIIFDINRIKSISIEEIDFIDRVNNLFNFNEIDYSKFEKRY